MSNDFELLVRSYADEVQALDAAATDLLALTSLDNAIGVQLDGIGQIVGLARAGLSDSQYRLLLRAQIRINTSGGTIEQLNEIARLASGTTATTPVFTLTESFPADFIIEFSTTLAPGVGSIIAEAVYQGKAAGVHGQTSYWEQVPVFAFDGAVGASFDGPSKLKTSIRNRGARESELL